MKISIIVPVFNVKDYLAECIESVIHQTYKDFELILVNDGSNDGSEIICNQYFLKHPQQINVIHKENRGPFHARLTGIQKSTGDVLVFLDSDDCLRKDALETIAFEFLNKNCDMVMYDAESCEAFETLPIKHHWDKSCFFDEETKRELYERIVCNQIPNSVCLKAVKRECAVIPESFYELGNIKYGEDLLLSTCLITESKKIVYINQGLYHYRNRPGSSIHSFDIQRKESVKAVHQELEKFISIWNLPELRKLHSVRKVKGWVNVLIYLFNSKDSLTRSEFNDELKNMANDEYFQSAYKNMDSKKLLLSYRVIAYCLAKKYFFILCTLMAAKQLVSK